MLERSPPPELEENNEESVPKHGCCSTDEDLNLLFQNLSIAAGTKPGVLSIVPEFSDSYVPKSCKENFLQFSDPYRIHHTCS